MPKHRTPIPRWRQTLSVIRREESRWSREPPRRPHGSPSSAPLSSRHPAAQPRPSRHAAWPACAHRTRPSLPSSDHDLIKTCIRHAIIGACRRRTHLQHKAAPALASSHSAVLSSQANSHGNTAIRLSACSRLEGFPTSSAPILKAVTSSGRFAPQARFLWRETGTAAPPAAKAPGVSFCQAYKNPTVTKLDNGVSSSVTKIPSTVTKRSRGRPALSGQPMTTAERMRRYRARRRDVTA
jgi:hypothetical protein